MRITTFDSVEGERDMPVGWRRRETAAPAITLKLEWIDALVHTTMTEEKHMAEERQSQRPTQPDGRHQQSGGQQSSGQSTQVIQSRGGAQQTGMARREGSMPSMFAMDPFEMLRISPFSLMRRFTEDMDQYFAQLGMGRGGQGTAAGSGLFVPPVEVVERDGTLTVRADLPGMTKDDIRVDMTENILTIEGERRAEHKEKQDGVVHSERRYGMFRRQIALPEGVNAEQATANF